MSDYKKSDRTDWACKTHRLSAEASVNPARYAADMHPYRCSKHPTLQKEYFLVADDPNYLEEGVQLVQFNWDGQISDNTEDQLLLIGQNSSTQIQRAEVPDNAFRDTVGLLCLIAHGYQKWAAEHKQFAVYTPKYSDGDIHSATAIDHRWEKRGQGEARVALGGSMTPSEIEKGGGFWPALVRRHIAYCRRLRFVPNFVRQHFIWCGDEKPSQKAPSRSSSSSGTACCNRLKL